MTAEYTSGQKEQKRRKRVLDKVLYIEALASQQHSEVQDPTDVALSILANKKSSPIERAAALLIRAKKAVQDDRPKPL